MSYPVWFKTSFVMLIMLVNSSLLYAKQMDQRQEQNEFLAEKVIFCDSRDSLIEYKEKAEIFDMNGLNNLVLTGRCDFVPDGHYLALPDYERYVIDATDVIAVPMPHVTIWTFKSLVSSELSETVLPVIEDAAMLNTLSVD